MTTPSTSAGPPSFGLKKIVDRTITKATDSYYINTNIKKALYDLCFNKKRITLQVSDPSYKLRYQYAARFWMEKTEKLENLSREDADDLVKELKSELNSKSCLYPEESNDNEENFGAFYSEDPKPKTRRTSKQHSVEQDEKPVWYLTSKCETKFYVKSANCSEDEKVVNKTDINLCSYSMICPGDEFQIESDGDKKRVCIIKSNGLTSEECNEDKANFIENVLNYFTCRDPWYDGSTWGLTCFDILCKRYQGIWNHIKSDQALLEDTQCVKNVLKLSLFLSKELSTEGGRFLEDLSCSLFFKTVLPQFIQNNSSELSDNELNELKSLLELMMELSPKTASKILKVAKYVANAFHVMSSGENSTHENSHCQGVEYLVHLGEILAKAVPGCEDVDTVNCEWNELPTIPSDKEILTAYDLKGIEAIRTNKPYQSIEQYLDINYRLLREECFRNLCTGIQNFRYDKTLQMKIYRILKLDTITRGNTQTILVLNCEDYYKKENSAEEEDTSCEILYGSLMCISLNKKFDSLIWATVVKCELQKDSDKKTISLKLCSKRNKLTNTDVLLKLLAITVEGDHALMAESPTFYSAFGPCMDRLQEMHRNGNMPLVDELVFARKSKAPSYTHDKNKKCDWSIIFKKSAGCDFAFPKDQELSPAEQFKHLKKNMNASESLLDETQLEAIANFLENRVSLIQGPPGTGKSFLGSKILRLMLSMGIHEEGRPILVMTYKNFALDHFLEACLEHTPNIVRIGQAGNEKLSHINLKNLHQEKKYVKELKCLYDEATENMSKWLSKLKWLFKCLSNQVFTFQSFLETLTEDHIRCLLCEEPNLNTDEYMVDELLVKWKRTKCVPKKLKELLRESLKRWLPKAEIQKRCGDYKRKDRSYPQKVGVSPSSIKDDEECLDLDEAIDRKSVAQERQREAVDDFADEDSEILDKPTMQENPDDDEPRTDHIKIPFSCLNNYQAKHFDNQLNLWDLSDEERLEFIRALQCEIIREFTNAVNHYEEEAQKRQTILDEDTVNLLKKFDVIGMTVTGAATRLHLLDKLKPCAVIVEEAAEIIEGQLISVLPPTIKHLVMLGDQQQLKPRVNCYKLIKKNLDCSMFERLIKNELRFQQLGRQCRMRDDIAQLLRLLNIYKDLETNHELTCKNEPPECTGRSLYFMKHTRMEEQIRGSSSLWNPKEIWLILDVAQYLLKNGYRPCDITVLCPYRGQVDKMNAEFRKKSADPSEEYFTKLREINITTVDSFQGKENKVILLSLVRSNQEDKIGFFGLQNRICVAISRARCALYIFGNTAVYSNSKNWKKIINYLGEKGFIGGLDKFKDEPDGTNPTEDEEQFGDATPLNPPEITRLSKHITGKWKQIARLQNLDGGVVDDVDHNDKQYHTPREKAEAILIIISKKRHFSRKKFAGHLEEEGCAYLMDDVLNGKYRNDTNSHGASPTTATAEH